MQWRVKISHDWRWNRFFLKIVEFVPFFLISFATFSASLQLKAAKLGKNSYVPAGLTAAQYQKIRDQDEAKKNSNYQGYASKAFKFITLDTFTKAREVSKGDSIVKDVTRGHTMAKLKYDYESGKQYDGSA